MLIFFVFILLFLLENLLLPALLGSGPFFISLIFILGLLLYTRSWKILIFQLVPIILIELIFTGVGVIKFTVPLIVVFLIYFSLSKFLDFSEQIREDISFKSVVMDVLLLLVLGSFYSFLFIFMDNSYNIVASWNTWKIFFLSAWLSMFGWSTAISILLKYIVK